MFLEEIVLYPTAFLFEQELHPSDCSNDSEFRVRTFRMHSHPNECSASEPSFLPTNKDPKALQMMNEMIMMFAISSIQSNVCPATSLADATLVGIHWRMCRRSLLLLMILYQKPCQIHQQGGRRCWMATCGVRPKGLCRQPLCRLLLRVQTLFDFQNNMQKKECLLQRGSWRLQ